MRWVHVARFVAVQPDSSSSSFFRLHASHTANTVTMAGVHEVNGHDYAHRRSSDDAIDSVDKIPTLTQVRSAGSISLTPELFEKLYLTPKTPHTGDALKRYANPTPLGFVGFVISTMTFSMVLMGWGGANGAYAVRYAILSLMAMYKR